MSNQSNYTNKGFPIDLKTTSPYISPFQSDLLRRILDYHPSPVIEAFSTLKRNLELNQTFDEAIQQKHRAVRSVLESFGLKDTKLIGAVQRKTRIQPLKGEKFDIDILVPLGSCYGWIPNGGILPSHALDYLHNTLLRSERYSAFEPEKKQPTITYEYKDGINVELVPAFIDMAGISPNGVAHTPIGRGFWVVRKGVWTLAEYDHEAAYITKANEDSDKLLIPLIKMLKALKRRYFPVMDSIHLEILSVLTIPGVIRARKELQFPVSYPILITDFFSFVEPLLSAAVQMPGSNAVPHILDIEQQVKVRKAFKIIEAYCKRGNLLKSEREKVEHWKLLFGDPFPAY